MKFERGKDPKKVIGIGMDPLHVTGISVLTSIDYTMAGECWNWKFIKPRRKRRIKKILSQLRDETEKKNYSIWTEESDNFYNNREEDNNTFGKVFLFDGEAYQMPVK